MKYIISIWLLLWFAFSVQAQTDYISHSRDMEHDCFADLGGKRGVLLLSKYKDLVIRATNAEYSSIKRSEKPNIDGFYEYRVLFDEVEQPHMEIHQTGSAYTTDFVVTMKQKDFLYAYRIEMVVNPIRIEPQQRAAAGRMNASEAEIEIRTTIPSLQVSCSPKLKATISRRVSADDQIIINVIVPIENLLEARSDTSVINRKLKALLEDTSKKSDEEWEEQDRQIDELRQKKQTADIYLSEISNISLYADSSNYLSLNIGDLDPRDKCYYVVVPLVVKKMVYATESSAFLNEGRSLYGMRKYKEARAAYQSALEASDVEENMRPVIFESMAYCDSCMHYERLAAVAVKGLAEMKKAGNATQLKVADYAGAAIDYYQYIYDNYNPNDVYLERRDKLKTFVEDMPLKVKFTIVEWRTLSEGNYIPNVEIWTYNGSPSVSSASFSSDRKFEQMVKKEPFNFKQVGISNSNGIAEIELNRNPLPEGFIFRPDKKSGIKIYYMSVSDFLLQAKGTYMEKQFRLKMYIK